MAVETVPTAERREPLPERFGLEVTDDGMAPIPKGAVVHVRRTSAGAPGSVVVLVAGGAAYVRRLKLADDGRVIATTSADAPEGLPEFDTFTVVGVVEKLQVDLYAPWGRRFLPQLAELDAWRAA